MLISRSGDGNKMLGNRMIRSTIGRPIIVGAAKEVNRFSFIFLLRACCFLVAAYVLVLDLLGRGVWRLLAEM